ncbi:L-serine ammonia-lyase [Actinoplanes bogorensis]|uniref:L-serine ammonia-lyase n=7 Tax=Actinomycetes TaxID=1760 RepID=A0ABS5YP75_9ACTN|nr:L-serine ammonia-lyase [Actinoplanes bogorensis]MBU2665260.1 L-serine ammonia-lyase [Actinoplanes bogorensis]
MAVSVFDLFSVGIGPSSSHTVGPMRAARMFADLLGTHTSAHDASSGDAEAHDASSGHAGAHGASLGDAGAHDASSGHAGSHDASSGDAGGHDATSGTGAAATAGRVVLVRAELFGSLGATGHGHGTPKAVLLGLEGSDPETVDVGTADARAAAIHSRGALTLPSGGDVAVDLVLHRRRTLPGHPNGMSFTAYDSAGAEVLQKTYYSVGGGFVLDETGSITADTTVLAHPFSTGADLLALTKETGLSISRLMLENETAWRPSAEIRTGLLEIWRVMRECVAAGLEAEGVLPGGLKVRRRAAATARQLRAAGSPSEHAMEWLTAYAMAVNEENAAGGRVVTAPTNGAAGIIPAVLHYYVSFVPGADDEGVVRFLLAAAATGLLFKENASISGAEVGCQGEVGSACAMAAAGLAEVLGGTPEQVENAAEIGMEHNLGLTCDPVGGLVQIPCIERNGMAAVKAVTAARMALRGDGRHHVSLDKVIKTMKETGADMKVKYKETARGGLAVNVIEC